MTSRKVIPIRTEMPAEDPLIRKQNFEQVETGFTESMAKDEARRCIQDIKKPCQGMCPVGINIPRVMELVEKGRLDAAAELIREQNLLFGVTSLVCPQSEQCESATLGCIVGRGAPSIAIGAVERFLYEYEQRHSGPRRPEMASETGKEVAIVGSGPAGLTVAAYLRKLGHRVMIFEALHTAGGVLAYGIPWFRLPKTIVRDEIDYVLSFGGIEIVTDAVIGKTYTVDEIRRAFDAVFFATGAGQPTTLGMIGEDIPGVLTANEWLTRINLMSGHRPEYETHLPQFTNAVIFGGGNVAMDSARAAIRMGVKHVTIAYRRTRAEMPARAQEIEHALEEGLHLEELLSPVRVVSLNGRVQGVECLRNTLGKPDASGRARPVPIDGSNFVIPAELIVTAIGQRPNPMIGSELPDAVVGRGGNMRVDQNGRTSVPGCFAGGDLARGGATVILAMGDGKRAASAIDAYLKGTCPWPTPKEFRPVT